MNRRSMPALFFLYILIVSNRSLFSGMSQPDNTWIKRAQVDLMAVHNIIKAHHPGVYDKYNPHFKQWLKYGYEESLNQADTIESYTDYIYTLQFFINGFRDSHLSVSFDKQQLPLYWPGFLIGYDGTSFKVLESILPELPIGMQLIQCHSFTPRQWLTRYSFPFRGNPTLESSWVLTAYYLSIWEGSSQIPQVKTYIFKDNTTNTMRTIKAHWQEMDRITLQTILQKTYSYNKTYGIQAITPAYIWVSLPSLKPQTLEEIHALTAITQELPHYYNKASLLVLDLRGNMHGTPLWSSALIKSMYGADYYIRSITRKKPRQYTEWRASNENKEYIQERIKYLMQQDHPNTQLIQQLNTISAGIERACQSNQAYYQDIEEGFIQYRDQLPPKPLSSAKVIVLIDSQCAGTCLDFIDELMLIDENIYLVGHTTSSTTYYDEVRSLDLPSGTARINFPIKVYRNRLRTLQQPHTPHYYWYGSITDTEALQQWIHQLFTEQNFNEQ